MKPETNYYSLTKKQITLLNLLYRFRFATSDLISQVTHIQRRTINKRLELLLEQEYIGRKHEGRYRLSGRYAVYYLSPNGIKALKKLSPQAYSAKVLRNYRHNAAISDGTTQDYLDVFQIACDLTANYDDAVQFFAQSQLANYPHFPQPLPNAYMQLKTEDKPKRFFLSYLRESEPFFIATREIKKYIDYLDNDLDEWKRKTKTAAPAILIVCSSTSLQKRLVKKMKRSVASTDGKFYTTTTTQLKTDEWHDMSNMDDALSLSSLW